MQHKFGGSREADDAEALLQCHLCHQRIVCIAKGEYRLHIYSLQNSQVQVRVRLQCYLAALTMQEMREKRRQREREPGEKVDRY